MRTTDMLAPAELLKRPYVKTLLKVDYSRRTADVFSDFVIMASCALSLGTREDEYLAVVKHYKPEQVKLITQAFAELVMDMEDHPYTDLLGSVYLDLQASSTKQARGEFYTPQAVSNCMAMMLAVAGDLPADRPMTLLEPAAGAGGMVLSAARVLRDAGVSPLVLKATCVDINLTSMMMCHINLTLNGIPAMCIHGDTLRMQEWRHLPTMFWY